MRTLSNLAAAGAATLLLAGAAAGQVKDYREIKTPALREFSMPKPKRIQLTNGMVIFIQEDHELPLIRGTATIRGGSRDVPAAKTGLAGIYGGSWRTGGTTTKTGDELDELLEARAARVETSASVESQTVSMDLLKQDLDTVFPIWVDVLRNPAFRQDKIDLAKTQANTAISRRNDEPGGILARETTKLGYGADSPYARQPEYSTIASITRDDLLAFHKRFVHPNNIILSFIGDFDSAQLERRLRQTFDGWARGPQAPPPSEAFANPAKPGLYFIAKDDVTQANIAMVHPGTTRRDPDYYALVVMNDVLSGGFSGRLMQALRSQRGLTYGVGGGVGANWDYPGLFRAQMATKSQTAIESVEALRGELKKMTETPVTAAELSLAKDSILNAFVFTRDTRAKALGQQVQLEFYGYPSDYHDKYPSNIEKVTGDDVLRVAKKHVHPDQLAILVIGKQADFDKPLASLGPVTPIDITIPTGDATSAKPAAASGSNAEGVALVQKVAEFAGGAAKLAGINALERTGSMTMVTPQGEMQAEVKALVQYPQSQRMVMTMPMGEITRVISPEAAFVITPMGTQDLPSSQRDSSLTEMKSDFLVVLKNISNPKYTFTATGTENVNGVDARVVEINADGSMVKWYVDPSSGKLLRTMSRATGPQPGDMVTEHKEWKAFNGLNMPVASLITRNGEKAAELKLSNVEINPTVDPKSFVKP
jgi:zinc protease